MNWAAALVLLALQDPGLEEARREDLRRIASRPALTPEERRRYVEASTLARASREPRTRYRIAAVPVGFADAPLGQRNLEAELRALADFCREMSGGALRISWTIIAGLQLEETRAAFGAIAAGSREEKRILSLRRPTEVDGAVFFVTGSIGDRGTALWPHKDALEFSDGPLDYLVVPEAGARTPAILAHEFGHLLGLEDKYEDREANVGDRCLMGTGYRGDAQGRPLPWCGVCREALGWAGAARVDPRTESRIVMTSGDLVRIDVTGDGKEALVLELRPRNPLIVWHVGGGKEIELTALLGTASADRLTPWSEPAFLGRSVGARTIFITDVRMEDRAAWITVGPTASLTAFEERRKAAVGKPLGR